MKGASENKLTLGEARGYLFRLFAEEYGKRNARIGTDPLPGVRGLTRVRYKSALQERVTRARYKSVLQERVCVVHV